MNSRRLCRQAAAALAASLLLASCASIDGVDAVSRMATPLELQAVQAREVSVPREMAFKAVMSVLQDLGYTLQSADLPSDFISAVSPTVDTTPAAERYLLGTESYSEVAVTASFLPLPNGTTRVRLNFVERRSRLGIMGTSRDDSPVVDPEVYELAWEKIDETLFMLTATNDLSRPAQTGARSPAPSN